MSTNTLTTAHVTADEKSWLLALVAQATQTVNVVTAVPAVIRQLASK